MIKLVLLIVATLFNCLFSLKIDTDFEIFVKDYRTDKLYTDKAECKDLIDVYLKSMHKDNTFALFETKTAHQTVSIASTGNIINKIKQYEIKEDGLKSELLILINYTKKDLKQTKVIVLGEYKNKKSIIAFEERYPKIEILTDIDIIQEKTKLVELKFLGENDVAYGGWQEMTIWLLLLIIFGPIIIVVFIVVMCFRFICRGSHHSAPLL